MSESPFDLNQFCIKEELLACRRESARMTPIAIFTAGLIVCGVAFLVLRQLANNDGPTAVTPPGTAPVQQSGIAAAAPVRATDNATEHCFVLCESPDPGNLSRASEIVDEVFGHGYSTGIDHRNRTITVTHGNDAIGLLVHAPLHIPTNEAEECADRNFLWPNGKEEAAKHRAHVIVASTRTDAQTPVQSAIAVSRLALVALKLFDGIGVYWGNASVSNSRDVFESLCANMSEQHMPVVMWLRFQVIRASDDEIGMYTLGMRQFGLMEIEVDRCRIPLQRLSGSVANLAHYLIQRGPIIKDEDTCGGSEEERFLVRYRSSMIDEDRLVYKIIMN